MLPRPPILPAHLGSPSKVQAHEGVGTFVTSLSHDQFMLYHELWRILFRGQEAPSRRALLPIELIRTISRMAQLAVPDITLTREESTGIIIRCTDHSFGTRVWFWTRPLNKIALNNIAGVQLTTISNRQGWAEIQADLGPRTWFDVGIIPLPLGIPAQRLLPLTCIKSKKPLRTLQGRHEESVQEVKDTIEAAMAMDPRWHRSHGCPVVQTPLIQVEGPIITREDDIWRHAKDGDLNTIAVRADAIFRGWLNQAYWGKLMVWKHFEPVVNI